jgi:DNA-directed RNA polymerase subunit M
MDLTFCEKCKGIMMPTPKGMKCRKCGHEIAKQTDMALKTKQKKGEIIVLEKDESTLPTIERACPSCSNETAYFWLIQTRSSDEPPTRFFRCTKCKYTWREYS